MMLYFYAFESASIRASVVAILLADGNIEDVNAILSERGWWRLVSSPSKSKSPPNSSSTSCRA
jgi:hypothetical protein